MYVYFLRRIKQRELYKRIKQNLSIHLFIIINLITNMDRYQIAPISFQSSTLDYYLFKIKLHYYFIELNIYFIQNILFNMLCKYMICIKISSLLYCNMTITTLLEIVSGIKKVPIPSGIMFDVLVFIPLSKSSLFRTVW